jgi:hypothetical protein
MAPSRKSPAAARGRRHQPVRGAEQIALLASPVRQDLVDTLEALGGEADVAAVAAQLGRPADGLYYHFDLLAKAGLLQRVDGDGGARRYRIGRGRGAPLKLDYGHDADSREAVGRVVDKLLQAARRDFHAALDDPDTMKEGAERELWAGRNKGWVNRRDLAEANRLLARLQQLLQGPRRPGRDRLLSLSFVIAPLPATPGRRSPRGTNTRR